MASVSSSSEESERFGESYNLSADVSESESSSSFYCTRYNNEHEGACSSSLTSSPLVVTTTTGTSSFPVQPFMLPVIGGKDVVIWEEKSEKLDSDLSELEMMKERFAKLLLGEDMSGGGKGVCTALAVSNAITNLSATVFGELWRLEPLAIQKKSMWCREMEWLLCVSDSIVELIPSVQEFPGGGTFEVMVPRPRSDLYMNLPALKKLDAMLLSMLDGFRDTEFWYVDRGIVMGDGEDGDVYPSPSSNGRPSVRQEEKWWLPCPRVPPNGLSEDARKRLQQCRDCTNQILKAAMAINSNVLAEMEIPSAFLETLPKTGKACLGDIIYRYVTAEKFSPECLLDCLDLSSEHHTLEIANRIEAAVHVWKRKDQKKRSNHTKTICGHLGAASQKVGGSHRNGEITLCENFSMLNTRLKVLDNTVNLPKEGPLPALDVGQSILESYSRVMESLAFNIMARIDDLLYVDDAIRQCVAAESMSMFGRGGFPIQKKISPSPFSIRHTPYASPFATPTFCSSTPVGGSPRRTHPSQKKISHLGMQDGKKLISAEVERMWSYAGNLSARRDSGDAPERD
ncbi:hypothetical protein IFM89_021780 [Coptis chinensis]|uniref:PRONE domain-containing protein n=1 Tax=Coptis chinensis TaxID=261450 RepID=A0A835MF41_9MAGN|nr:hypothetical protein IFM89_021780 [Coptis chinensis]